MPSYDREKRRGVLARLVAQQSNVPAGVRPTKPMGYEGGRPTTGAQLDPGFYRDKPSANALVGGDAGPQKGRLGNLRDVKSVGADTRVGGKQIGFFNATHKHGEPMEGLIAQLAKLKQRRKKGPQSYEPSVSASPRAR